MGESASIHREREGELRVVDGHRTGNIERDLLVRRLEHSAVEMVVAQADAQASVGREVARMIGRLMLVEMGRGASIAMSPWLSAER